jgi:hypothetical protein
LIIALGLCGVTYPEILITVAWKNFVGIKAVNFVTTTCFETPFILILQSYLSLVHAFIVLCVLTKTSTYLFSFKGTSKTATHSQTPNSQRAVVSLRAVLYQEITPTVGMAAIGQNLCLPSISTYSFADYFCGTNFKAEFKRPLAGPDF